ncbi:MAG TPA: hypothetical protein VFA10_00545, partial [Ktedonobacteraceae bacterium]|nr:hypothetical protein [Ktedonobacteraceae bacterium]
MQQQSQSVGTGFITSEAQVSRFSPERRIRPTRLVRHFIPPTPVPVPQGIASSHFVQLQLRGKAILSAPATKMILGLMIGIGLLFLIARFVNVSQTLSTLQHTLTTPQGIALALLSGVAFLTAFSIRGIRWKLFLNPIGKISTFRA